MNGTDTKQSAGYFREKAIIGLSSLTGDEVDKAIMKVTSHMLKAPKEKYMQSLLAASYGHTRQYQKNGLPINDYIVRELEKRSHTHNWIIVLKSMVVLHRLLTDGSNEIVAVICRYRNIFSLRNIKELADTSSGAAQKYFIEEYMRYLEERAVSQTALGYNRRMETKEFDDYMNSLNAADLLEPFESLLRMLEALLMINYREVIVDNFCTMEAYQNVIRDGKTVFQLLSKRVIFILSGFEDLPISLKKMWLGLYKRYDTAAARLKDLFDSMIRSTRAFAEPIPQLKPLPESLLRRLEHDVEMSTKPQEVESLESLGIKSEGRRADKEEKLPLPPPGAQRPAQPPATSAGAPAPPKAEPAPAKPAFSMDDLFQPAPAPPAQPTQPVSSQYGFTASGGPFATNNYGTNNTVPAPQSQTGNTDYYGGGFGSGGGDGWSTGAPTTVASGWSTGAPVTGGGDAWSTGAPQFQQQPPVGNLSGNYYSSSSNTNTGGASGFQSYSPPPFPQHQQQQQQVPPTQAAKPSDPFKDLYSETQRQWH